MRKITIKWLKHAEADLKAARDSLSVYPSGLAGDLAPTEFYEREDAEKCIRFAESILKTAKIFLGK
jgi:HEPN domain-containing protein